MENNNSVNNSMNSEKKEQGNLKIRRVIYYVLGALEVLLAFRLVFKILGANAKSAFVAAIYSISNVFLAPFSGIFRTAETKGIETQSVLEPALIIAMIVYALLAWGIVKLVDIMSNRKETETL